MHTKFSRQEEGQQVDYFVDTVQDLVADMRWQGYILQIVCGTIPICLSAYHSRSVHKFDRCVVAECVSG